MDTAPYSFHSDDEANNLAWDLVFNGLASEVSMQKLFCNLGTTVGMNWNLHKEGQALPEKDITF